MVQLEYLLALAEEKNLTRAAQRLYISQPTLTKYLNRLEAELGVTLFDRTRSPVRLTPAGQLYLQDMQKLQSRELALRARLKALAHSEQIFTIGMQGVRSQHLLPKMLPDFLARHPGVSIQTDSRGEELLEAAVDAGEADIAVGALSFAYEELEYTLLSAEEVLLVLSRDHPVLTHLQPEEGTLENPCLLSPAQVQGERLLLPRTGGGQHRAAMQMVERHHLVPGGTIQCPNVQTLFLLAAEGQGMLFTTPGPFLSQFPETVPRLALCRLQPEPILQRSALCYRRDRAQEPLIADFAALIQQLHI